MVEKGLRRFLDFLWVLTLSAYLERSFLIPKNCAALDPPPPWKHDARMRYVLSFLAKGAPTFKHKAGITKELVCLSVKIHLMAQCALQLQQACTV